MVEPHKCVDCNDSNTQTFFFWEYDEFCEKRRSDPKVDAAVVMDIARRKGGAMPKTEKPTGPVETVEEADEYFEEWKWSFTCRNKSTFAGRFLHEPHTVSMKPTQLNDTSDKERLRFLTRKSGSEDVEYNIIRRRKVSQIKMRLGSEGDGRLFDNHAAEVKAHFRSKVFDHLPAFETIPSDTDVEQLMRVYCHKAGLPPPIFECDGHGLKPASSAGGGADVEGDLTPAALSGLGGMVTSPGKGATGGTGSQSTRTSKTATVFSGMELRTTHNYDNDESTDDGMDDTDDGGLLSTEGHMKRCGLSGVMAGKKKGQALRRFGEHLEKRSDPHTDPAHTVGQEHLRAGELAQIFHRGGYTTMDQQRLTELRGLVNKLGVRLVVAVKLIFLNMDVKLSISDPDRHQHDRMTAFVEMALAWSSDPENWPSEITPETDSFDCTVPRLTDLHLVPQDAMRRSKLMLLKNGLAEFIKAERYATDPSIVGRYCKITLEKLDEIPEDVQDDSMELGVSAIMGVLRGMAPICGAEFRELGSVADVLKLRNSLATDEGHVVQSAVEATKAWKDIQTTHLTFAEKNEKWEGPIAKLKVEFPKDVLQSPSIVIATFKNLEQAKLEVEPGLTGGVDFVAREALIAAGSAVGLQETLSTLAMVHVATIKQMFQAATAYYGVGGLSLGKANFDTAIYICTKLLSEDADSSKLSALIGAVETAVAAGAALTDEMLISIRAQLQGCEGLQVVAKSQPRTIAVLVKLCGKLASRSLAIGQSPSGSTLSLNLIRSLCSWTPKEELDAIVGPFGGADSLMLIMESAHEIQDKLRWFSDLAGDTSEKAASLGLPQMKSLVQLELTLKDRIAALPESGHILDGTAATDALATLQATLRDIAAACVADTVKYMGDDRAGLKQYEDTRNGLADGAHWVDRGEGVALDVLLQVFTEKLASNFDIDAIFAATEKAWSKLDRLVEVSEPFGERIDLASVYTQIAEPLALLHALTTTAVEHICLAGIQRMHGTNRPALKRYVGKQAKFLEKHTSVSVHPTLAAAIRTLLTSTRKLM
jgi:hypothetical protein